MLLILIFAFLAGLVTILSYSILPVITPLLPPNDRLDKSRAVAILTGWLVSFVACFTALTLFMQHFGLQATAVRYTAVLLIGFFGFVLVLPTFSLLFAKCVALFTKWNTDLLFSPNIEEEKRGGILLGGMLGLTWAPFAWLILAACATLMTTQHVTAVSTLLACIYSLGVGVPLFLFASGTRPFIDEAPTYVDYADKARQVIGGLMIVTAAIFAYNWDTFFEHAVLHDLPDMQIENQAWVDKQLQPLRSPNPSFPNQDQDPFSRIISTASVDITPAIYLGYERGNSLMQTPQLLPDLTYSYNDRFDTIGLNQVGLKGKWEAHANDILSQSNTSQLKVNFKADRVYLVLGGKSELPIQLQLDGKPIPANYHSSDANDTGDIFVDKSRLYQLLNLKGENGRHELVLTIPQGIKVYAFTFSGKE
ncbi:hypothetical protein PNK_0996 [Candidatus Protochlamydia naegleriophila]|uniref:DipZ thioredoxin-like C-terminal domain-containing protein n=1 Tax=Candidatus Protochlamydia naegleriophila TaxID=389348 RepID=A0A0U5K3D5_9BACT|nr:hypothetical protein [Candidatus Protochlamydia naegleriophila]CUI16619.1 hypothetical protein PNK_0996 [Candidatus Protochlamydia naegleriophila]